MWFLLEVYHYHYHMVGQHVLGEDGESWGKLEIYIGSTRPLIWHSRPITFGWRLKTSATSSTSIFKLAFISILFYSKNKRWIGTPTGTSTQSPRWKATAVYSAARGFSRNFPKGCWKNSPNLIWNIPQLFPKLLKKFSILLHKSNVNCQKSSHD